MREEQGSPTEKLTLFIIGREVEGAEGRRGGAGQEPKSVSQRGTLGLIQRFTQRHGHCEGD